MSDTDDHAIPATESPPTAAPAPTDNGPDITVNGKRKHPFIPAAIRALIAPVKAVISNAKDVIAIPGDVAHLAADIVHGRPVLPAALKLASDAASAAYITESLTPYGAGMAAARSAYHDVHKTQTDNRAWERAEAERLAAIPPALPSSDPKDLAAALAASGGAESHRATGTVKSDPSIPPAPLTQSAGTSTAQVAAR